MKLTDDDREKLREFETEDLLLAVDHLDEMRGELADHGIRPPAIRMKLLELHQIAFDVIKRGHQFPDGMDMIETTDEILESIENIIDNAEKLQSVISDFQQLLPEPDYDDF